jgi:hypothetical protein
MRNLTTFVLVAFLVQFTQATCIFSKAVEVKETNIGNIISWNTSEEKDNEQFLIEKSLDGLQFTTVGDIKGAGTSSTVQKYRFLDISTGEDKVFYRISYIDSKKIAAFTPTFMVKRTVENNFIITAMSSLTTDSKIAVTVRAAIDAPFSYTILDKDKKIMQKNSIDLVKGANVLSLNVTLFKKGDYTLQLSSEKEVEEITFRKVEEGSMPNINYVVKE